MSRRFSNTVLARSAELSMADRPELDHQANHEGHQEWLLDESLAETFPASDPISPAQARVPLALLAKRKTRG